MVVDRLCIFLVLLGIAASSRGQNPPEPLEARKAIAELFPTVEIRSNGEFTWIPAEAEKTIFKPDAGGFCHTILDTVFYYEQYGTAMALMVFITFNFDEYEIESCHACAPHTGLATYRKMPDGSWTKANFRKSAMQSGAWGQPGDSRILKLSPQGDYVFIAGMAYTATGNMISIETWIDTDRYGEIFRIELLDEYPSGCAGRCDQDWCYEFRSTVRKVSLLPKPTAWSDLMVETKVLSCKNPEEKTSAKYHFDGLKYVNSGD